MPNDEFKPVTISYATASEIVYLLKAARDYLESKHFQGSSCVEVVNLLKREMGKPEDYK